MELVRGLHNVDRAARGCVLTIGAFDGIHRGHQEMIRVLRTTRREASAARGPAVLRADAARVFRQGHAAGAPDAFSREVRGAAAVRRRALRVPALRRGAALDERRRIHRQRAGGGAGRAPRRRRSRLQVRAQHGGQRGDAARRRARGGFRSHRSAAVRDRRRARQQFADSRGAGCGRHGACRAAARAAVPDDR